MIIPNVQLRQQTRTWRLVQPALCRESNPQLVRPWPTLASGCPRGAASHCSWAKARCRATGRAGPRRGGFTFRFVELAQEIDAQMPNYVVTRLTDLLRTEKMRSFAQDFSSPRRAPPNAASTR